jgi:hypothetical protein
MREVEELEGHDGMGSIHGRIWLGSDKQWSLILQIMDNNTLSSLYLAK